MDDTWGHRHVGESNMLQLVEITLSLMNKLIVKHFYAISCMNDGKIKSY